MRRSQRAKIPVGIPPGTRLLQIERVAGEGWVLWIHTRDFIHGTHLALNDDGSMQRITTRVGEGDDIINVKPPDADT